ncbi:ORF896 [White spot syndrome virus]|uniref:ORF896 n=1 Tax=White spot syndrome virus TaxID=342409 RepID=A0A2D3I5E4_9VIRU|nr:ORF896 [White spot syndrome virus]
MVEVASFLLFSDVSLSAIHVFINSLRVLASAALKTSADIPSFTARSFSRSFIAASHASRALFCSSRTESIAETVLSSSSTVFVHCSRFSTLSSYTLSIVDFRSSIV